MGLDDKILLWIGKGRTRMACDLGLGDDDMNRGSSQPGVCHGERRGSERACWWLGELTTNATKLADAKRRKKRGREGAKDEGRRGGGQGSAN